MILELFATLYITTCCKQATPKQTDSNRDLIGNIRQKLIGCLG